MTFVYRSANSQRRVRSWAEERIEGWAVRPVRSQVPTSAGATSVVAAGPVASGDAPTVVLVPGTNMSAASCLRIAGLLAERRRTVLLDVPGQPGLSAGWRPTRGRMAWYGNWLSEALEQTVPGPAVVVGHSLGGAIALAGGSPRIAGRVLVSTAGLTRLRVPVALTAATLPWLVRSSAPRTARFLRHLAAPDAALPTELVDWMTLVGQCCRSSLAPPPLPDAVLADRRRSAPCAVVTGRHDAFVPPDALGPAARRRLGVELHVVEDAGHLLLDERPDVIAALVDDFCAKL